MKISNAPRPKPLTSQEPPKQEPPKEPWQKDVADVLERSNDAMGYGLPKFALAAKFAAKGNQFSESLHPISKVAFVGGGAAIGYFLGKTGGELLHAGSSKAADSLFGDETSLGKSLFATGLNTAAFGLLGGVKGAALYGAFTVGGAAQIMRDDLIAQG